MFAFLVSNAILFGAVWWVSQSADELEATTHARRQLLQDFENLRVALYGTNGSDPAGAEALNEVRHAVTELRGRWQRLHPVPGVQPALSRCNAGWILILEEDGTQATSLHAKVAGDG